MTQDELVKEVASSLGYSNVMIKGVLKQLAQTITSRLRADEEVALPGIGKLTIRHLKSRAGRNPLTNTAITIPARNTVFLKVTKKLKDVV